MRMRAGSCERRTQTARNPSKVCSLACVAALRWHRWNKRPILGSDPVVLALNAGTGLKNLGRPREAIPYLEHCLQRDPRNTRCRQRLDEARHMQ
eukprot:m.159596 g.159596  ORF g.159596 m.159596 type:complete len:94 (+) comp18007_c0_seq12:2101-2382(+)